MKTLLEESTRVRARRVRQTVEFTVKLLRIRRSLEQHDRLCWPVREHSNESWNLFVKRSIPRAFSPVLENFRLRFSRPNWPPLGLRRCIFGWKLRKLHGSFFEIVAKSGDCKTSAPQSLRDLRNRRASKTIRTWNKQTLRACLHVGGDPR